MSAFSVTPTEGWLEANQRGLAAALGAIRAALDRDGTGTAEGESSHGERSDGTAATGVWSAPPPGDAESAPALDALCAAFGLTPFERQVLLLCAGTELDASFAAACSAAQGNPARPGATFALALAALPGPHWSALAPSGPLRRWRLIELTDPARPATSPLRIDERVLHYLVGVQHLDERLAGVVEPVAPERELVASEQAVAQQLAGVWSAPAGEPLPPVTQLCGPDPAAKQAVAAAALGPLGLELLAVAARRLPTDPRELDGLVRLLEREAALCGYVLLLDCEDLDGLDPTREAAVAQLIAAVGVPVLVSTPDRRSTGRRPTVACWVRKPTPYEQRECWRRALDGAMTSQSIDALVARFDLGPRAIREACDHAAGQAGAISAPRGTEALAAALWEACRSQARPGLDALAQRVEPDATWDDLVVTPPQQVVLEQIVVHVTHRLTVYDDWGLGRLGGGRGLGTSALFSGPSGTGKTLAAEVLAGELGLDLYRIDLSQVVSKYIGETEKNLRRVFDAAQEGGAVLLFDEADALFGKRSDVKDSHDRYANIEVSYLLQRMEAYRGLAILTTNLKDALDPAFSRRIRFVASFPFPDAVLRAQIWRRAFPPATPTKGLDMDMLARLNVTGGSIRNIAVNAAFLAAAAGEPVGMAHLERAARGEYAKLDKALTAAEIAGWT